MRVKSYGADCGGRYELGLKADFGFRAGVDFWRGVNLLKDRLKLDNFVTRGMWVVMKLVRVASKHHLLNWETPDALVQEITPSGELNG